MQTSNIDRILRKLAIKHHTTVQEVRREMEYAMEAGMANSDPEIQARWAAIPRKGAKLTLEEFLCYLSEEFQRTQAK